MSGRTDRIRKLACPMHHIFPISVLCTALVFSSGCSQQEQSPDSPVSTTETRSVDNEIPMPAEQDVPHRRNFRFNYAGVIDGLEPGQQADVWLPLAQDTFEQTILGTTIVVPGDVQTTTEARFGNKLVYFRGQADNRGEIAFQILYKVQRDEYRSGQEEKVSNEDLEKFRQATDRVPIDRNLTSVVFPDSPPPQPGNDTLAFGRAIYDAIFERMRYEKPVGGDWGHGDAVWACDSRYGNCTDFHSLFLALCRESKVASRFEIGFPIDTGRATGEVGGYHCWAKFANGNRWVVVDISEADRDPAKKDYYFGNLPSARFTLSIGRDLQLEPRQKSGPVNFLVYPHVEVDGVHHMRFRKRFSFSDLSAEDAAGG